MFQFKTLIIYYIILARDEKPPKVIMTNKSFDSVTLSFDHFAPKGYKHGYVAMVSYRNWINYWIDSIIQKFSHSYLTYLVHISIFCSLNKSMGEELILGNTRSNLKMIYDAHVLETRLPLESTDFCQIRNIWLALQFTQIIHYVVLEKLQAWSSSKPRVS